FGSRTVSKWNKTGCRFSTLAKHFELAIYAAPENRNGTRGGFLAQIAAAAELQHAPWPRLHRRCPGCSPHLAGQFSLAGDDFASFRAAAEESVWQRRAGRICRLVLAVRRADSPYLAAGWQFRHGSGRGLESRQRHTLLVSLSAHPAPGRAFLFGPGFLL